MNHQHSHRRISERVHSTNSPAWSGPNVTLLDQQRDSDGRLSVSDERKRPNRFKQACVRMFGSRPTPQTMALTVVVGCFLCLAMMFVTDSLDMLNSVDSAYGPDGSYKIQQGSVAGKDFMFTHVIFMDNPILLKSKAKKLRSNKLWKSLGLAIHKAATQNIGVQTLVVLRKGVDPDSTVPPFTYSAFQSKYVDLKAEPMGRDTIPYRVVMKHAPKSPGEIRSVTAYEHMQRLSQRRPMKRYDFEVKMDRLEYEMFEEKGSRLDTEAKDGDEGEGEEEGQGEGGKGKEEGTKEENEVVDPIQDLDSVRFLQVRDALDTAIAYGLGRYLVYTDLASTSSLHVDFYRNVVDHLSVNSRVYFEKRNKEEVAAQFDFDEDVEDVVDHQMAALLQAHTKDEVGFSLRVNDRFLHAMVIPLSWLRNDNPRPFQVVPQSSNMWKSYPLMYSKKPNWQPISSSLRAAEHIHPVSSKSRAFGKEILREMARVDLMKSLRNEGAIGLHSMDRIPFGAPLLGRTNWDHALACVLQTVRRESRFPTLRDPSGFFYDVDVDSAGRIDQSRSTQLRKTDVLVDHFNSVEIIKSLMSNQVIFDPSEWLSPTVVQYAKEKFGNVDFQNLCTCFTESGDLKPVQVAKKKWRSVSTVLSKSTYAPLLVFRDVDLVDRVERVSWMCGFIPTSPSKYAQSLYENFCEPETTKPRIKPACRM